MAGRAVQNLRTFGAIRMNNTDNDTPKPAESGPLEAGRDVDRAVAEKLGWKNDGSGLGMYYPPNGKIASRCESEIPHYSTDIASAFKLLEKYQLSLIRLDDDEWLCGRPGDETRQYNVPGIYAEDNGNCVVEFKDYKVATTAAHAICLSFLAVELGEGEAD
jgi:hypothetical protein